MYYANCEWYVDMGEHYKPLCERNSLRPAKCSECPVYIGSIEAENAKLRELIKNALTYIEYEGCGVECPETGNSATLTSCDICNRYETESCAYVIAQSARELGIEVING